MKHLKTVLASAAISAVAAVGAGAHPGHDSDEQPGFGGYPAAPMAMPGMSAPAAAGGYGLRGMGSAAALPGMGGTGMIGGMGMGASMGGGGMMPMMMRMHQAMMSGMTGGMGMGAGMGMSGMKALLPRLQADADGDGRVTPEELRARLGTLLEKYDTDRNGALSLGEFARLHADLMRETMVDRFQFLDDDGDGAVTASEIVKPAILLERMQAMMSASGAAMPQAGMGGTPARGAALPGEPGPMMPGQTRGTGMSERPEEMMPGGKGMMTGKGRMMEDN